MKQLALTLLATVLASCVHATEVPESTTTDAPADREITAKSADGLFEVIIPAGALSAPTEIVISTWRTQIPIGAVGSVYEVNTADAVELRMPARARAYLPAGVNGPWFTIVQVRWGEVAPIDGADYDPVLKISGGSVTSLAGPRFALVESTEVPCTGLDCEASIAEGWDDLVGTGAAFTVNHINIADRESAPNALWPLGPLMNDQLRQGLLGGEELILFELTGLDEPLRRDDRSSTLRIYQGADFDDPFFPANNFKVPPGHTVCCEFLAAQSSLDGNRARSQGRARIENHRLSAEVAGGLSLSFGYPFLVLTELQVGATIASDLKTMSDIELSAVVLFRDLAQVANPYCKTISPGCTGNRPDSSVLHLIVTLIDARSDVDMDGDGLEEIIDSDGDGELDRCYDGDGTIVDAIDPLDLETCALNPRIADGYSIRVQANAIAAQIRGVYPDLGIESLSYHASDGTLYLEVSGPSITRSLEISAHTSRGTENVAHELGQRIARFELPNVAAGEQVEIQAFAGSTTQPIDRELVVAPPLQPVLHRHVCCMSNGTGTCQREQDRSAGVPCPSSAEANLCTSDSSCDHESGISAIYDPSAFTARSVGDRISVTSTADSPEGSLLEARSLDRVARAVIPAGGGTVSVPNGGSDTIVARIFLPNGTSSKPVEVQVLP